MSVKEINKLGKAINEISEKHKENVNLILNSLPESCEIIKFKKSGNEYISFKEYRRQVEAYIDIIQLKKLAWGEMIKLIEEFAIKEQKRRAKKK